MHFFIDLRYVIPPLINLILLLLTSQGGSSSSIFIQVKGSNIDEYPILEFSFFILAVFLLILFLLTSIKLPLTAHPVTVQAGYFSGPLTLSFLASIFCPPPIFWVLYFTIVVLSPWHGTIWYLLKCIFHWFYITLKSIPPLVITCNRQQDDPEAASPRPEVEFVDIERNPTPNQSVAHNL